MLDSLNVLSGLIGLAAALAAAVVVVLWVRSDRSRDWDPHSRGSRWFAAITRPLPVLAGAALLALVSGLLLASADDEDEQAADSTSIQLLRELVDEDARDCREGDPTGGATAALTCSFSDRPMRTLRISLFASDAALRDAEQDKLESAGASEGTCATRTTGWERWRHGILICDNGQQGFPPHLEWSRRDSRVLIQAQAHEGASPRHVYDWWLKESNGAPANNRLPYPDRVEDRVLRRAGLERDACARVATFKGSSAALRCSAPGIDYLFLSQYDTAAALKQALGNPPGEGSCVPVADGAEPGRRRYEVEGTVAGTRAGHSLADDDASVVEWTNDSTRLYGYASTRGTSGADLARIFGWWERTGRFLTD